MNWKKLSSEYISSHPYFTARKDRCQMPDGRIVEQYFVAELRPCVCALPITEDGKVILTKQYRHPIEETVIELPGGFVDENETNEEAIARELKEETGYSFESYEYLGKVAANPGVLNNYTCLFLAKGGKKEAAQQLDADENIEVVLYTLEEVKQMLVNNEFTQALHVCCLHYAFNKMAF